MSMVKNILEDRCSRLCEFVILGEVHKEERLRWSRGSVLAFSTQVRGFKPGRSRRSHVVDLRHVKDCQMAWKSSFR